MPDWGQVLKERGLDGWKVEPVHDRVVSPDGRIPLTLEEVQRPRQLVEHMVQKRGVK